MAKGRPSWRPLAALAVVLGLSQSAAAESDLSYLYGRRVGDQIVYPAQGVHVSMEAIDPTVMRWYLPQELYLEVGRRQWGYTNYARETYTRYVERDLEGIYFYDVYGNLATRGWQVYDWHQTQPSTSASSSITKSGRYVGWFNRLVISQDQAGDYAYSITIGDELNTTLTPMTFRKAGFNGVVPSLAGPRLRFTGIFGRLTAPVVDSQFAQIVDNYTNLTGGRLLVDLRDDVSLGLTFVNAHNATGVDKAFSTNPLHGRLTTGQRSQRLGLLAIRLSDDSPEDGESGAVLFSDDIEISLVLRRAVDVGDSVRIVERDTTISGSDIGFHGARTGGSVRGGFLTADGPEAITITYPLVSQTEQDLGSLLLRLQQALSLSSAEAEDAITSIYNVRFRLRLANDYRVEVASDRQANVSGQPQFLPVTRAAGNIKSGVNQTTVVFDYGLPTANQIFGVTLQTRDFYGFDIYGEANWNHQFRQYPSTTRKHQKVFSGIRSDDEAFAFLLNVRRQIGRLRFTGEAFGMEDAYTTSLIPVDGTGLADYSPEAVDEHFELVDDNDDNDRHPDQLRAYQGSLIEPRSTTRTDFVIQRAGQADPAVFPGYDENNDGLSDFNQNSNGDQENFYPDYEEPFLRHNVDRPEFLFGMDMNNNGWVDRFENDDEPDYPYKKDLWGYNAHGRLDLIPGVAVTAGRLDEERRATARRSVVNYALAAFERDFPHWGRLRVFDMVKSARDGIRDDLVQWVQPEPVFGDPGRSVGQNEPVPDVLAAQDALINTFYADWSQEAPARWRMQHRIKWETWRQRDVAKVFAVDEVTGEPLLDEEGRPVVDFDPLGPEGRDGRPVSGFFGVINKADWRLHWRQLTIAPRVKSEYLRQTPFDRASSSRRSWDLIPSTVVSVPVLRNTLLELGWEHRRFRELRADEAELEDGSLTGDFDGSVLALQVQVGRPYLGYDVRTFMGVRMDRRKLEVVGASNQTRTTGLAYLTVYAGLADD